MCVHAETEETELLYKVILVFKINSYTQKHIKKRYEIVGIINSLKCSNLHRNAIHNTSLLPKHLQKFIMSQLALYIWQMCHCFIYLPLLRVEHC
jgi:hypothetical protein